MKRDLVRLAGILMLVGTAAADAAAADDSDIAQRIDIATNGGKLILTTSNEPYFVPMGGDETATASRIPAYTGSQHVVIVRPANGGVVTLFDGGGAYFSADGLNLGGGGGTVRAYDGTQRILGIYAAGGGVVTHFSEGGVYFSPTGTQLGGGGLTVRAYEGTQRVVALKEVQGGVQTRFSGGGVYGSSTGTHLGGGGATVSLPYWEDVSSYSAFGRRDSARGIEYEGRYWLSSGFYGGPYNYYDLWYSDDALTWTSTGVSAGPFTEAPADATYPPYSPLVKSDDGLYAVGASVWRSPDGLTWSLISSQGPARATEDTFAFHHAGQFVFLHTQYGQVYSSTNGIEWSAPILIPGFQGRCGALVTSAQGRLWMMGGGACSYGAVYDDIWSSEDGVEWTQVLDDATGQPKKLEWPGRMWPCVSVSPTGVMWMFGGFVLNNGSGQNLNDLWYSKDGVTWTQARTSGTNSNWRHAPTCYSQIDQGRIVVTAGKGGDDPSNDLARALNDVKIIRVPVDELLP